LFITNAEKSPLGGGNPHRYAARSRRHRAGPDWTQRLVTVPARTKHNRGPSLRSGCPPRPRPVASPRTRNGNHNNRACHLCPPLASTPRGQRSTRDRRQPGGPGGPTLRARRYSGPLLPVPPRQSSLAGARHIGGSNLLAEFDEIHTLPPDNNARGILHPEHSAMR
jgi:hypothetical protein